MLMSIVFLSLFFVCLFFLFCGCLLLLRICMPHLLICTFLHSSPIASHRDHHLCHVNDYCVWDLTFVFLIYIFFVTYYYICFQVFYGTLFCLFFFTFAFFRSV